MKEEIKPNIVVDWYDQVGKGWLPILKTLNNEINNILENYKISEDDHWPIFVQQIKEKFGTLRVYLSCNEEISSDDIIKLDTISDAMEVMSQYLCEDCGSSQEVQNSTKTGSRNGWTRTLCKACRILRDLS